MSTWAAILALTALWPVALCRGAERSRPNILFVFADDWGRLASAYRQADGPGDLLDAVHTPHFDRVAAEGVLFRNAFVNAPSCTPCRSSLFSGQYFWRTGRGAILRDAYWEERLPSWPLLLRDHGYRIGKSGKVWSPGMPVDAPVDGQRHAYEQSGRRIHQFSQHATQMVARGKSFAESRDAILAEVRANFRAFLDDRGQQRPFCYWFGPTNVHRPWVRGSGQALWGIDPDALKGKLPPFLPDVAQVREDLADYLGEVQALDAALGALLAELQESGQYDQTLIVISGDHGPPGFPHGKCNLYDFGTRVALAIAGPNVCGGRVVEDLVSLPDLAPTLLEAGGVEPPAEMTARSLWPILRADRAGTVDPTRTAVLIGRERHVAGARAGHLPYPQRAIRTAEYLFIINFRPQRYPLGDPYRLDGADAPSPRELCNDTYVTLPDEDAGPTKAWLVEHRLDPTWKSYFDHAYGLRPREELFDLRQDPHQMRNVAADPAYAGVIEPLRQRLLQELAQSGDPRLVDDGAFFETPPMAGPPADAPEPPQPRRE
jgi:arylsulfatase A-like enzyme